MDGRGRFSCDFRGLLTTTCRSDHCEKHSRSCWHEPLPQFAPHNDFSSPIAFPNPALTSCQSQSHSCFHGLLFSDRLAQLGKSAPIGGERLLILKIGFRTLTLCLKKIS